MSVDSIRPNYTVDSKEPWVQYKDRAEWADLVPVPQNDGTNPVVKIMYSEDFIDVYDYLRGVMAVKELSQRALHLTEDAIEMNAANYTVWRYRRLILESIDANLRDELNFCRYMIEDNPKNYQVWHHRRVIAEWLDDGTEEKRLTQIIFALDAKNYHAWEHRQWALHKFNLYDGELEFTEDLIKNDARNNSAWNHRFYVVKQTTGITTEVLRTELAFTKQSIVELPGNESPWSFLKGLLVQCAGDAASIRLEWRATEDWAWQQLLLAHRASEAGAADAGMTNGTGDEAQRPDDVTLLATLSRVTVGAVDTQMLIGVMDLVTQRLKTSKLEEDKDLPRQLISKLCSMLILQDELRCVYWRALGRRITATE